MHFLKNLLEPQNFKFTCQFYFLEMMLYIRVFQQFSTHGTRTVEAHHQFFRERFIIKTSHKIVFNSSIAKILRIVLFIKIMMVMDFNNFCILLFDLRRTPMAHLQTLHGTPVCCDTTYIIRNIYCTKILWQEDIDLSVPHI